MRRAAKYLSLVIIAMVALSCKRNDPPQVDLGFAYYPLEVGSSLEYTVDSIVYDEFNESVDTFHFELREECTDTFTDAEGRTAYRFERSVRHPDSSQFVFRKAFYVVTDGVRTEKFEDNQRIVVMIYPPVRDEPWDANVFNQEPRQNYVFRKVHSEETFGGQAYDSVLQLILRIDTDNFIVKRYSEEHYAKHVGLVQKRFYHIETQFQVDSGLLWIQTIKP